MGKALSGELSDMRTGLVNTLLDLINSLNDFFTQIQKSAELIGYFVEVDVWSKMILKSVTATQSFTSIMVLASVIKGSERTALKPYLQSICETVTNPDVCQSIQVRLYMYY